MSWAYKFDARALRELKKLGPQAQRDILRFLDHRVASHTNPRLFGKGLKAELAGLWRHRVGDYRILSQISDRDQTVLVGRRRPPQRHLRLSGGSSLTKPQSHQGFKSLR